MWIQKGPDNRTNAQGSLFQVRGKTWLSYFDGGLLEMEISLWRGWLIDGQLPKIWTNHRLDVDRRGRITLAMKVASESERDSLIS